MNIVLWLLLLATISYGWARYSMRHVKVGNDSAIVHKKSSSHQKKGRIVLYKHGAKHYSQT